MCVMWCVCVCVCVCVRVYEMQFMDIVFEVEAHIAEVLCIEYSPLHDSTFLTYSDCTYSTSCL